MLVTVVASQELEVGDVLRRFKAKVSRDEPRRGNNINRHTRSTSARFLEIVTVYWIFLTFVGIFTFLDDTCVCMCVSVCGLFYYDVAYFLYKTRERHLPC